MARVMRARSLHVAHGYVAHSYVAHARGLSQSAAVSKCGEYERIADIYSGRSVLVTGGTGFLGKILIERLLYNCKDIGNIYVLIRQKKDVTLHRRLEEMFSLPIFSRLKEDRPQDLNKVIPVHGDLLEDRLGIKSTDQKLLQDKVTMVFHTAATVSFKMPLKQLLDTNYSGTRRVLELSRGMRNLESFLYFSTAFLNAATRVLEEAPVPPMVTTQRLEDCLRTGRTDELLSVLNAPMYIFTKSVAESAVVQERGELPTTIIRPSAVTACLRDPLPGWMDTWIAHPAFFVEHSRGLVSAAVGHRDVVADIIPADYVANLAIVAAARGRRRRELRVYNCCTGGAHPMSWQEGADLFRERAEADGRWVLPPKRLVMSSSPALVWALTLTRDTVPALLRDLALILRGRRPKYLKMHLRARFIRHCCIAVMSRSVIFKSSQTFLLSQTLDEEDRGRFPFDVNTISWPAYLAQIYDGIYKYMMKKYSMLLLVSTLLFIQSGIAQNAGEQCRIQHTGSVGRCEFADRCYSARDDYRQNGIRPSFCSDQLYGGVPLVCCRDRTTILQTAEEPRPHYNADRRRVSERKCEEYSRGVVQTVGFIALVPEPEEMTISAAKCDYTGVELILGGESANQGEFPHMAAVGWVTDEEKYAFYCGGSLISSRFVLTAGHCTYKPRQKHNEPSVVRLGEQNLDPTVRDGATPIDVPIKHIHKHPKYKPPSKYDDIALLELVTDVDFTNDVRPACLWNRDSLRPHTKALATGWGVVDQQTRRTSDDLQKVSLSLFDNNSCNRLLEGEEKRHWEQGVIDTQVCAGELRGGKDTCQGDSGSPLQVASSENQCIFHLIGVTSFGGRCAQPGRPAIYTRVSKYLNWIESIVWPGE